MVIINKKTINSIYIFGLIKWPIIGISGIKTRWPWICSRLYKYLGCCACSSAAVYSIKNLKWYCVAIFWRNISFFSHFCRCYSFVGKQPGDTDQNVSIGKRCTKVRSTSNVFIFANDLLNYFRAFPFPEFHQ